MPKENGTTYEQKFQRTAKVRKFREEVTRKYLSPGSYPGFCIMKRLGAFLLPPDGILVVAGTQKFV